MASDELQSDSEMEHVLSQDAPSPDVQTGMQSVRSDLQSLSDRLQKVEDGQSQSQTPSPSPRPAQRASADVLPSLPYSSRSWADRVEQEEDDDAFEHSMDLDVEPGDDAKGIRIFPLEEATEPFLSQSLSSPLPSQVRRQLRERFGKPNLPEATTPAGQCDASTDVVSSHGKRQGAGKDPGVLSRCVRPTSPLYQRGQ